MKHYNIGMNVRIKEENIIGTIVGVWKCADGITFYRIERYGNKFNELIDSFLHSELEPIDYAEEV